jgi:hypothetical protein
MAITFVGSSSAIGGSGSGVTSLSLTKPAAVQDGDFILVQFTATGSGSLVTGTITGFTSIDSVGGALNTSDSYGSFYKVASSEGASWTLNLSASCWVDAIVYVFRSTSTTISNHSTKHDASAYTTTLPQAASTINGTSDATLYVYAGTNSAASGSVTVTAPAALSNAAQTNNANSGSVIMVAWGINVASPGSATASDLLDYTDGFVDIAPSAILTQVSYRWRNDDGSETSATWITTEQTDITKPINTNIRIRLLLDTNGDPASNQYQVDYQKVGDSVWHKVKVLGG